MRKLHRQIFFKYFVACAGIILCVLTVVGCFCCVILANQRIDEVSENLESAAGKLSAMYARMPKNSVMIARPLMGTSMEVVRDALDVDIVIVRASGMVAMTTLGDEYENVQNELVPQDALASVLGGESYRRTGVFLQGQERPLNAFTVGVPIIAADNVITGAVFVTTTKTGLWKTLAPFIALYMLFMVLSLSVALSIIYFVSARMFRPLTQMGEAVRAYADGDFSMRVDVRHNDELGDLAAAFNNMADSLGQLEKMRQQFVEDVSHELRTPMTSIGGFIDGILDGVIEPAEQTKYLRIVSDEIKRLSRMVSSMLDAAKIQSGTMVYNVTDFDIAEVIQKNLTSFEERIAEKRVRVVWQASERDDYYVHADADSVYRIVYNLLDNALKFVREDGTLTVRLETRADTVLTAVRNDGDGIPQKDVGHIFERFYKMDKSRSRNKWGVGIGLYLVQNMVRGNGGDIFVSSKEGEFAEFSFTLPKAAEP